MICTEGKTSLGIINFILIGFECHFLLAVTNLDTLNQMLVTDTNECVI